MLILAHARLRQLRHIEHGSGSDRKGGNGDYVVIICDDLLYKLVLVHILAHIIRHALPKREN